MEGSLKFCYCWKYCKIASWEKLVDSQCWPVKREGLYLEFFSISPKPFTFVQDWKLRNCILVHFLYFHLKLWLRPVSLTLSCSLYDFASRYKIWQTFIKTWFDQKKALIETILPSFFWIINESLTKPTFLSMTDRRLQKEKDHATKDFNIFSTDMFSISKLYMRLSSEVWRGIFLCWAAVTGS